MTLKLLSEWIWLWMWQGFSTLRFLHSLLFLWLFQRKWLECAWFRKYCISWHTSVFYRKSDNHLQWQGFIQVIQSCVVKTSKSVIAIMQNDADANRLIRQLDWKDLSTQFQIQKSIMVYKSLNGLVPEYLSSKFVKRNETRYSLRDSVNKLFVPFPRTNFMKNSFTYSGAVLWNSLPCHVREAESLSQFKRLVNVHF